MKSKPRAKLTQQCTDKDERFLSSFKEYATLLVDESCRELKPGEKYSTPGAEFYRAGRRLVKDSIGLEIADEVKELVDEVDDLAARGKLTPDAGRVIPTPSGMSIYGVWETFNGLGKYFENMGLALYSGVDVFQNKHIVDICLGEAENIKLPGGPDVVVFTKTLIERTSDRIENKARANSDEITSDWTTYEKIYHPIEPKLQSGRGIWSRSKGKGTRKTPLDKMESLAWAGLISESDDRDTFSKKYAVVYIKDTYLHEVYHSRIFERWQRGGHVEEAAAQLYSVSRGENPLGSLMDFYEWKDASFPSVEYKKAARLAFRYLKKAGYKESLWRKLEMSRSPEFDMTLSTVRKQAENALTMLERDNNMRDHNRVERNIGISGNYRKLNRELERIILSK